MKELCDKFNKIIDTHLKLNRGTEAFSAHLEQRATTKLFRHILAQVYSRAVTDPDKLRDYQPFSPSVNSLQTKSKHFLCLFRFMVKHLRI
jgi:H3 lysine-79-specific histone-lysine N-methyltransferase